MNLVRTSGLCWRPALIMKTWTLKRVVNVAVDSRRVMQACSAASFLVRWFRAVSVRGWSCIDLSRECEPASFRREVHPRRSNSNKKGFFQT